MTIDNLSVSFFGKLKKRGRSITGAVVGVAVVAFLLLALAPNDVSAIVLTVCQYAKAHGW
jgi:hypothetical protein